MNLFSFWTAWSRNGRNLNYERIFKMRDKLLRLCHCVPIIALALTSCAGPMGVGFVDAKFETNVTIDDFGCLVDPKYASQAQELYTKITQSQDPDAAVALATLIRQHGRLPRVVGSFMDYPSYQATELLKNLIETQFAPWDVLRKDFVATAGWERLVIYTLDLINNEPGPITDYSFDPKLTKMAVATGYFKDSARRFQSPEALSQYLIAQQKVRDDQSTKVTDQAVAQIEKPSEGLYNALGVLSAIGNAAQGVNDQTQIPSAVRQKTYNIQVNRPVGPAFVPGTQNNGTYQDDAGCKSCLTNPAFLTWKQRCNDQTTAQSASHCAAAVLDRCMIDHGGCGQTIPQLQSAMTSDVDAAAQLGARCFAN